jgi:outer membrane protein assembly factor BamB
MRKSWVLPLGYFLLACSSAAPAQVPVPTYQYDNYRSGANTRETALTTANVNVSQFGRQSVFTVQGDVYAQPLYVPGINIAGTAHDVVFVATEHDQVYAFDVNSGRQLWHTNFLKNSGPLDVISTVADTDVNCSDISPEVGITGTPAIDLATNTMYVLAITKDYNPQTRIATFNQTLHALDIRSGADKVTPHHVTGLARGTGYGSVGGIQWFNPLLDAQREALLVADGQLFVAWGSYCDIGAYHGWLMSFNESTLAASGVYIDTPNGYDGGFWASGSGPAADAGGSIYACSGNGHFSADTGGIDFGDTLVRLTWSASGITQSDYFTPWDELTLDHNDSDFGAGGMVLLPDQPGTTYPHLLVQAGKEGTIDLLNRDNLGHFHYGGDTQIVQTLPYAVGPLLSSPAFWNNTMYFGGVQDHLKAFAFDPHAQRLSSGPTSVSPEIFAFPGPTPVVSSNGASHGIVWAIQADNSSSYAVLRAFTADNLGTELYNSEQNSGRDRAGSKIKFVVPTVADGHVFVGTQSQVAMYGLLH